MTIEMLHAMLYAECDEMRASDLRVPMPWIGDPGRALAESIARVTDREDARETEGRMVAIMMMASGR